MTNMFGCQQIFALIFILIKILARIYSSVRKKAAEMKTDIYITDAIPNIFLWLSLIPQVCGNNSAAFWGIIFYFTLIYFDERYMFRMFRKEVFKVENK